MNTLDSMLGYRQPPYEDLGWAPARLDDLANLAPSRLTMLSTAAISGRPLRTLLTALRYGPLTASPNAGMAEAAFAGALDVRLGGANAYGGIMREGPILGDGRQPAADDIRRAVDLMHRICVLVGILALLAESVRPWLGAGHSTLATATTAPTATSSRGPSTSVSESY